jgi:hypothetical protein
VFLSPSPFFFCGSRGSFRLLFAPHPTLTRPLYCIDILIIASPKSLRPDTQTFTLGSTLIKLCLTHGSPPRWHSDSDTAHAVRNLKKKLRQIEELERVVAAGQAISPEQHVKLLTKTDVLVQIERLEANAWVLV